MLGERRLPVEGPLADALPAREGAAITAGLRPEGWRVAPATNRNLPAEVSHTEVLGNEQLTTCRLHHGNHLITIRCPPELDIVSGQTLHLEPDPEGWRLFDAAGDAIPIPKNQEPEPPKQPELPQISG